MTDKDQEGDCCISLHQRTWQPRPEGAMETRKAALEYRRVCVQPRKGSDRGTATVTIDRSVSNLCKPFLTP